EKCILVDDSSAGAQSGIAAGMEVFYFCADPHNKPIDHPNVTTYPKRVIKQGVGELLTPFLLLVAANWRQRLPRWRQI
ncbi:hypothetical protein MJM34_19870, partial [Salmonella enterica subsp. enterica serovar Montevideo]|nr:hypothetical protein [Salmonella enterica subsp. enterica serovar Montevideo]